uniref:Uncharacterized protein n=1 Tax=Loa loa TaxID=7209 RepID=E9L813_LOALO|nr:hypothetical protein [Loa loa]
MKRIQIRILMISLMFRLTCKTLLAKEKAQVRMKVTPLFKLVQRYKGNLPSRLPMILKTMKKRKK